MIYQVRKKVTPFFAFSALATSVAIASADEDKTESKEVNQIEQTKLEKVRLDERIKNSDTSKEETSLKVQKLNLVLQQSKTKLKLVEIKKEEPKKEDTSNSSQEKKEEKKEVKKMDLEAIANGDYSSIAGVWQDDKGNKLVFNDKGLVSQELEGYGASLTDYGTASEGIYGGRDGGFLLEYIPAGVTIGDQVDDQGQVVFKDTSDASKNRLWSGVGIASFGEQGSIYYHVGDE